MSNEPDENSSFGFWMGLIFFAVFVVWWMGGGCGNMLADWGCSAYG